MRWNDIFVFVLEQIFNFTENVLILTHRMCPYTSNIIKIDFKNTAHNLKIHTYPGGMEWTVRPLGFSPIIFFQLIHVTADWQWGKLRRRNVKWLLCFLLGVSRCYRLILGIWEKEKIGYKVRQWLQFGRFYTKDVWQAVDSMGLKSEENWVLN